MSPDNKAQEAMVESLMSGTAEYRERFIIETLLDLKSHCAMQCMSERQGIRPSVLASAISTGVAAAFIAVLEYIKSLHK